MLNMTLLISSPKTKENKTIIWFNDIPLHLFKQFSPYISYLSILWVTYTGFLCLSLSLWFELVSLFFSVSVFSLLIDFFSLNSLLYRMISSSYSNSYISYLGFTWATPILSIDIQTCSRRPLASFPFIDLKTFV